MRFRKGLSSVIGGLIVIALVVLILGAISTIGIRNVRTLQQVQQLGTNLRMVAENTQLLLSYNITGNYVYLTIKNSGDLRAWLKWLVLSVNGTKVAVNLFDFVRAPSVLASHGFWLVSLVGGGNVSLDGDGVMYLDPEGAMLIRMTANYTPVSLVLRQGRVVMIPPYASVSANSSVAQVAGSVLVWPINLASLLTGIFTNSTIGNTLNVSQSEIQQPLPSNLGTGMMQYRHYLVLAYNFTDVVLTLSGRFNGARGFWFGDALIGLDPVWTRTRVGAPKFTMGLTTFMPGCYQCNILTVRFANGTTREFHMDYDFDNGWRVVVLGFVPSSLNDLELRYSNPNYGINVDSTGVNTIGIWWDYGERENYESGGQAWVYANGTAEQVLIYKAVPGSLEFSYRPYFYTMDVDNDGIPEFVFSTEDAGAGHAGTCNDYALTAWRYPSTLLMDDWSVKPFWINVTGSAYQIPGWKYAMVTVTIRVYFHDNLGDDVDEVDFANRTIFGIYLIGSDGKIYSSREYDYQELAALEDTYPPNKNFFIMNVPLLVPDLNQTFHIGIMFQDPYDDCYHTYFGVGQTGYDDGDFTVAIEWLGLTFYARP